MVVLRHAHKMRVHALIIVGFWAAAVTRTRVPFSRTDNSAQHGCHENHHQYCRGSAPHHAAIVGLIPTQVKLIWVRAPFSITMANMKLMTIGQIAGQCSISRDTIRYYEKFGLLPRAQRTSSGYRLYSQETVRRLRVIRNGIQFGFSLKELAGFLSSRDRGIPPCQSVRAAGERLVQSIEKQIAELSAARDSMRATLADWDERLTRAPKGFPSGLLANVGDVNHGHTKKLP